MIDALDEYHHDPMKWAVGTVLAGNAEHGGCSAQELVENVREFLVACFESEALRNFDPIARSHFNTTPMDNDIEASGFEYVLNDEVGRFASTQLHILEHSVGRNLALSQGRWWTVDFDSEGKQLLQSIPSLSIENPMYLNGA